MTYPLDAAGVRDLIREVMRPHVNHGSGMDTGGGIGAADLWLQIGEREYVITVKPGRQLPPITKPTAPRGD